LLEIHRIMLETDKINTLAMLEMLEGLIKSRWGDDFHSQDASSITDATEHRIVSLGQELFKPYKKGCFYVHDKRPNMLYWVDTKHVMRGYDLEGNGAHWASVVGKEIYGLERLDFHEVSSHRATSMIRLFMQRLGYTKGNRIKGYGLIASVSVFHYDMIGEHDVYGTSSWEVILYSKENSSVTLFSSSASVLHEEFKNNITRELVNGLPVLHDIEGKDVGDFIVYDCYKLPKDVIRSDFFNKLGSFFIKIDGKKYKITAKQRMQLSKYLQGMDIKNT
jgi:hypothetical protein